jgi:hypothetical protein
MTSDFNELIDLKIPPADVCEIMYVSVLIGMMSLVAQPAASVATQINKRTDAEYLRMDILPTVI